MKQAKNKQLLLAHRGYCAIAPENTQLSFDLANLYGFDGIELDVHLTKDQQLVILHDESTKRTTLIDHLVHQTNYKDLIKLNYAAFFVPSVPHQNLMKLETFLDRYLHLPHFKVINIEIKTDIIAYPNIEKCLHKLVAKYSQAKQKIVFSSFNFQSLQKMHDLDSDWQLGFLFWKKKEFKKIPKQKVLAICKYLNPWINLYDKMKLEILDYHLPLCLWTIKSESKFSKYLKDKYVFLQIANYKY